MRTKLKITFRRYWPAIQDGTCFNGHPIRERRRRPCPECGELRRSFQRFTTESLGALDIAS